MIIPYFSTNLGTIFNDDCIAVLKNTSSKSIELVLTDIPYNVINRPSNGLRNFDKTDADLLTFDLKTFLDEINRVCYGSCYIFCSSEQCSYIRSTFISYKLSTRHCIWRKTNPSPANGQYLWLSAIENCIFARNKGAVFNEHCKSCVWDYPVGRNKYHPTEKPLKLFEYLINVSSNPGDLVLDPCCGGGTTCLAAERLNRIWIGCDINKDYCETTKQRLSEI